MQVRAFWEARRVHKAQSHKGALRRKEKQAVAVEVHSGDQATRGPFCQAEEFRCSLRSGLGSIVMRPAEREWLKLRAGTEGCDPKGTKETALAGLENQLTGYGRTHSFVSCFLKLPSSAK